MRGSVEAVAVARDVASSSPSKNASALDMMRYQRISPDCLPLANGSGSGGSSSASRKLPAPAPRSSTDVHDAPAVSVAADSPRLASYLATTASLEQHKPRARAPHPPPAPSPAAAVVIRSPARDHGYQPPDLADHAALNHNANGATPDVSVRLQWGHNKRSRGRRDSPAPAPAPVPAHTPAPETPAQARRRASIKIQRRAAAASASSSASASAPVPAEKLMPPPSTRGVPGFRAASSLPPRAAAFAAADALHGRTLALQHHRSAEEPRAGAEQQQPAAAAAVKQHHRPQRAASDREKGKAAASPEPPKRQGELQKVLAAAARPEVPRIFTQLSRKEKEEDFLAMKGTKLPQRPKKRTKAVEKAVSMICPGQWLSEVSRSRYMVREKKSKKQRRGGGLKAMDSDSD